MWILRCHLHINNSSKNLVNVLLHTLFYTYNPNIYTYLNALWAVYFSKSILKDHIGRAFPLCQTRAVCVGHNPCRCYYTHFTDEKRGSQRGLNCMSWPVCQTGCLKRNGDKLHLSTMKHIRILSHCQLRKVNDIMLMFWCDPKIPSVTSGPGGHQMNHQ